jgi:hypothetical protein
MLSKPRDSLVTPLLHEGVLVYGRLGIVLVWLENTRNDERLEHKPSADAVSR